MLPKLFPQLHQFFLSRTGRMDAGSNRKAVRGNRPCMWSGAAALRGSKGLEVHRYLVTSTCAFTCTDSQHQNTHLLGPGRYDYGGHEGDRGEALYRGDTGSLWEASLIAQPPGKTAACGSAAMASQETLGIHPPTPISPVVTVRSNDGASKPPSMRVQLVTGKSPASIC